MNTIISVFDGHNDTLLEFYKSKPDNVRNFALEQPFLDIDLPRAQKGGFKGGFFSLFTSPPPESVESDPEWGLTITNQGYTMTMQSPVDQAYAHQWTNKLITFIGKITAALPEDITLVRSYADLAENWKKAKLAIILHLEDAAPIDKELCNLDSYYQQGIRSIGIVWSRPNVFGCGVPFAFPADPNTGEGLTPAGKDLVRACNARGIMIDLAHINEKGFWDVARISKKPLVVTHAGVHALCPSTRNLTNKQIDAIGASGGVIGIIFEPINTRLDGKPNADTPLRTIVDHILYVANRIGIDHVAFGSDFDGCQTPTDLKNVSHLQHLIHELRKAKLSEHDIEKIAYKNWFRVLKETWI